MLLHSGKVPSQLPDHLAGFGKWHGAKRRPLSSAATQLGLRSGGGSACPSSMGFSIDGCNVCEARISPRFS